MNGTAKHVMYGVTAALFLGLSGWTLKSVKDLSVSVARIEQDEEWVKKILSHQADKQ